MGSTRNYVCSDNSLLLSAGNGFPQKTASFACPFAPMNRSILTAAGIFVILCLYMLTGLFGCSGPEEEAGTAASAERDRMTVQVREIRAREIPREVNLTGKTAPSRRVLLRAETSGKVIFVEEKRGMEVKEGELIARLELNDRPERLEQARVSLKQARLEYEAAQRLQEKALRSESEVVQALSRLRAAEQQVRAFELDIRNTEIRAPYDGILQDRMVEVGDFLSVGDPLAELIDLDPLVVEGEATEFEIEYLEIGEVGHADLADGHQVDGIVRYTAGAGNPQTRTFTVELEVDNPGNQIPAGITARIVVETERVLAHKVNPGLISVADSGQYGVKIVDEANVVRFIQADIVRTEPEALWLTGMPEVVRIITVGQGFTKDGDQVKTELESGTW